MPFPVLYNPNESELQEEKKREEVYQARLKPFFSGAYMRSSPANYPGRNLDDGEAISREVKRIKQELQNIEDLKRILGKYKQFDRIQIDQALAQRRAQYSEMMTNIAQARAEKQKHPQKADAIEQAAQLEEGMARRLLLTEINPLIASQSDEAMSAMLEQYSNEFEEPARKQLKLLEGELLKRHADFVASLKEPDPVVPPKNP